jgi:hypothetical protein
MIVTISYFINIIVAGSMALLLMTNHRKMNAVFGDVTPARQILSSIYCAIAVTSMITLIMPQHTIAIALVLFPFQIFYKITTLLTVSSKRNPVIWWNLVIAFIHTVSLYTIYTS